MKVNFYDEIRQMITKEFGIGTNKIKEIVTQEINQVVKSMVQRAVDQMTKGQDLEKVVEQAVKKEFSVNNWGISDTVKTAIRNVINNQLKLTIKENE